MRVKNIVLIAPVFPYTFFQFAKAFKKLGWRVLVIADVPDAHLSPQLVEHIEGYYRVHDMHHYPHLQDAMRYFIDRFGPIDFLESNIEFWLRYDAQLREDFNIPHGLRPNELAQYQSKSHTKKFYQKAHVPVARYELLSTIEAAKAFASQVGYPIFIKPDRGVGSQASFKLNHETQLIDFFARKPEQVFIMEEYIEGDIFSFDGMTNDQGDVVFYTGHHFPNNIASIVNEDAESYYVTLKELPEELIVKGKAAVQAFGIKDRLFHFEFFCLKKDYPHLGTIGQFVALEGNIRPPGGFTLEMFNYANSLNSYQLYAEVITNHSWIDTSPGKKYYCAKVGRKHHHQYRHDFDTIRQNYQSAIVFEHAYPYPISIAMGDYFFLATFSTREEVEQFFQFVLAK
jgi:hypothetical protein